MQIDPILLLDYTIWANDRVINGARQLPSKVLSSPIRAGWISPLGVLAHMLAADQAWLARWRGGTPERLLTQNDLPNLDAILQAWYPIRENMRVFLAGIDDPNRVIVYRTTSGLEYRQPLWQLILHLFNHNTEHRAQVALVLAQNGIDVGGQDVIAFLRSV